MKQPTVHTWVPFKVMLLAALVIASAITSLRQCAPPLFINITASEPRGIYRLRHQEPNAFARGMYVIFPVPLAVQPWVYGRGWLPPGAPVLKEVRGLAGDEVCISSQDVFINGQTLGPVFEVDGDGFPLPQLHGCRMLKQGDFFAASTHLDRSFDGRYFGPLPLSLIIGEAVPVWTW